jgi:hypothetical protein
MSAVAGGGGGHSGTNWYAHDVAEMWAMLKDQQTDNHWRQVAGWKKTYQLTDAHLGWLGKYRDDLVAAWSPEKSTAAKAYVERLDQLIENVRQTHEAAVANYTVTSTAIGAIGMARSELKQVYDDYVAQQDARDPTPSGTSSTAPSTAPSRTPSPLPGPPAANKAEIERLNAKARQIMSKLSGELSLAQVRLQPPPVYTQRRTIKVPNGDSDAYGGTGSPPPPIPPIMTMSTATYSAPTHGPAPGPAATVPAPTAPGAGPILGGAGPSAAPPTVAPAPPAVITPAPTQPLGGLMPTVPGPGMVPAPGYGSGTPFNPVTGSPIKPGTGGVAGTPRAMPPGGIIGGAPGAGLGQPGIGASAARRINPIGGLIGGNGAGSRPISIGADGTRGAFGTGRSPVGGLSGGHQEPHRGAGEPGQRWDPDNPWELTEGVAPVVLPAAEVRRIDPGPAIGLHR